MSHEREEEHVDEEERVADTRDYYKAKYQKLEDLPGIGPSVLSKLKELGYHTVEAISTAHPMELVSEGIGEATADTIVKAARKAMSIEFVTASELVKMRAGRKKLTTGSDALDKLFNGGLETDSITEFYGEFGAGKSQLCHQLAATVQLPIEEGGLNGKCLYIDTEQVFRPNRVITMAKRLGLNDEKKLLDNIIFAEAYSSSHQMILLENSDEIIKTHNIKLIIIDSLTSHFRSEYIGREMLAPRQQQLNKHMTKLRKLAGAFNAVAVVTNQVLATPDAYSFEPKPIGGNIVGHIAHSRCYIRKGRNNVRIIKIVASPFLPEGETPVRITEDGIVSDEVL